MPRHLMRFCTSAPFRCLLFLALCVADVKAQDYVFSTFVGIAGNSGTADGAANVARLNSPFGLTIDRNSNLLIADSLNHAIRRITASGIVTTVAGTASISGAADGPVKTALLNTPFGVAVDQIGNVFDSDTQAHTIRKITPDGFVTTLAGVAGVFGTADGIGNAARFRNPQGIAVDNNGNVIVADTANNTIRKITPAGVTTTLAGQAGIRGSADGPLAAAQFSGPRNIAMDSSGNLYLSDFNNNTIRKISVSGQVTTLAGLAGTSGSVDGIGTAARFNHPEGVALDARGNLFVAEQGNHTIRKITMSGVVTTIAGLAGSSGTADGAGNAARFNVPTGIVFDSSGVLFVADCLNHTIRKGVPIFRAPTIVTTPQSQEANAGSQAAFSVSAIGSEVKYQWKKDGVPIAGATNSTYQIETVLLADAGSYSVVVVSGGGTTESPPAVLTVRNVSRLSNLSARGVVPAGGDLIVGFVIRGRGNKSLLVRAIGPTLESFGISGALPDPKIDVIPAGASDVANSNDDWGGSATLTNAFASAGAFVLATGSKDSALLGTLPVAGYTARVTSTILGGSGIALAELYDRDSADAASRLTNVSTLAFVGTGAQVLVPGFSIDGATSKLLLIRAVGPGLAPFGVSDALADPQITVIPLGGAAPVASNDNWGGDPVLANAFVAVAAFALPPTSKDAAVVVRLPSGAYTVTVSGVGNTTGRALVEIYDLDPE